jgi:tubulin--tyrosine ligase
MVHLTNDAVQKKGRNYGKFESCNKMSFREFEIYLDTKTKTPKGKFAKSY